MVDVEGPSSMFRLFWTKVWCNRWDRTGIRHVLLCMMLQWIVLGTSTVCFLVPCISSSLLECLSISQELIPFLRMFLLKRSIWVLNFSFNSWKDVWACNGLIWKYTLSTLISISTKCFWYSSIRSFINPAEQVLRLFSQAIFNAGSIFSKEGKICTWSPRGFKSPLIYSWNALTCQYMWLLLKPFDQAWEEET